MDYKKIAELANKIIAKQEVIRNIYCKIGGHTNAPETFNKAMIESIESLEKEMNNLREKLSKEVNPK